MPNVARVLPFHIEFIKNNDEVFLKLMEAEARNLVSKELDDCDEQQVDMIVMSVAQTILGS